MYTKKQLEPPTDKQLSYIKLLERKTGLKFYGTSKYQAINFIEKANQIIKENKYIKRKIEREHEQFPYPDLSNDLPSSKQWAYIRSLEESTNLTFNGVTKKDAVEFINYAKGLINNK